MKRSIQKERIKKVIFFVNKWKLAAQKREKYFTQNVIQPIAFDHQLSEEMVFWGIQTWAEKFTFNELQTLLKEATSHSSLRLGIILAGSVPMVGVEEALIALALGSKVWIKTPQNMIASLRVLQNSLLKEAPELAENLKISSNRREIDPIFEWAEVVEAFGSDLTIKQLRKKAEFSQTRFIGYGHRVSFGIAGFEAKPQKYSANFALDIAAFDQKGCMSPQTIFVPQKNKFIWAETIAKELDLLGEKLPRGKLTSSQHASILQARGVCDFIGTSWSTKDGLVLCEPKFDFRFSPGPRTIYIVGYQTIKEIFTLPIWKTISVSTIGVAGEKSFFRSLKTAISTTFLQDARLVSAATMQIPVLVRKHDGMKRVGSWFH